MIDASTTCSISLAPPATHNDMLNEHIITTLSVLLFDDVTYSRSCSDSPPYFHFHAM